MTILLVRPTASGGLAAHVDQELALLEAAGRDVREAPVRIRERPDLLEDLRTVRTLRQILSSATLAIPATTTTTAQPAQRAQPAQPAESAESSESTESAGSPRFAPSAVTVHAHGLRAGALAAVAMWGLSRHHLVVTLHNRTVGSLPTRVVGALLLRLLARRANTVLAVSPDLAETARKAGAGDVHHAIIPAPSPTDAATGATDAVLVPMGTDAVPVPATAAAVPSEARGGSHLEILVIARLAPQKGLHDLLDAAALLRDGAPVRIRVAGDGPLAQELDARIHAERLPVELLGRRDDVPALLAACDLLVSAAHWEGQPVSLQEALRAGRAIVATDAGGTRWVTADAAHLVPVGDPAALAAAITTMQDPALRSTAEESARRRALELPTAEDLLAQLDEVLAPGPRHW